MGERQGKRGEGSKSFFTLGLGSWPWSSCQYLKEPL